MFLRTLREAQKPPDEILHNGGVQAVDDVLSATLIAHEACRLERGEVVAERRLAYVEVLGELARREVAVAQKLEDAPPVGSASALKPSPGIDPPSVVFCSVRLSYS